MKVSILIKIGYCCLFILVFASCKKEFKGDVDSNNFKIDPYDLTYITDLLYNSNGDVFITGVNKEQTLLILKTNAQGNLLWKKELKGTDEIQLASTSDGNILILNYDDHPLFNCVDLMITKLNTDGGLINEIRFSAIPRDTANPKTCINNYLIDYSPDGNGGFFFLIGTNNNYTTYSDRYIIHYSSSGSLDKQISLDSFSLSLKDINDLHLISNKQGDILLNYYQPQGGGGYYVEKLDRSDYFANKLTTVWKINYKNGFYKTFNMVADGRYGYSCGVVMDAKKLNTSSVEVAKVDLNNGSLIKKWNMPITIAMRDTLLSSLVLERILEDETSIYMNLYSENKAFILKSSKEGTPLWVKQIGGNFNSTSGSFLRMGGDELIFAAYGEYNQGVNNNAILCRFDKDGKLLAK